MPDHDDRTPNGVDLSRPAESTRRHLYELVVRVHFNPSAEEIEQAAQEGYGRHLSGYGLRTRG